MFSLNHINFLNLTPPAWYAFDSLTVSLHPEIEYYDELDISGLIPASQNLEKNPGTSTVAFLLRLTLPTCPYRLIIKFRW